jgi:hypothetical protein
MADPVGCPWEEISVCWGNPRAGHPAYARRGAPVLSAASVAVLPGAVARLEELDRVTVLTELLSPVLATARG